MFERFTREAREAVVDAYLVARQTSSRSIDSRHLLVALAERSGPAAASLDAVDVDRPALARALRAEIGDASLDADALASLGIDLAAVRRQADAVFGPGALDRPRATPSRGHLPFTREAKSLLQVALREAVRTGAATIGGGQLLLGLLRLPDALAGPALERALQQAGSDPVALRWTLEHPDARAG